MLTLKNTLLASATLAIIVTVFAVGTPEPLEGQPRAREVLVVNPDSAPVPVTVQDGASEDTLLTLVQDASAFSGGAPVLFGPVDVREYRTVSFVATTSVASTVGTTRVRLGFAGEPGEITDPLTTRSLFFSGEVGPYGLQQTTGNPNASTVPIGGPYLVGEVIFSGGVSETLVTVKAYLSK